MEVIRDEQPEWLTNSYLVIDRERSKGILVDANGRTGELLERADAEGIEVSYLLLTHEHWDHVLDAGALAAERGLTVLAHPEAAPMLDFEVTPIEGGDTVELDGFDVQALHTPGHSDVHLAFLIDGTDLFSGDVLFAGTVGGTMLPGQSGFEEMRSSVMDVLMELDAETRVHPGHAGPTTIGDELEANPFVRVWRGVDPEGEESCEVADAGPATLILWAPDYDGTNKAWVKFPDGTEGITGGSRVERG
ncbi:MAG: MBL fold metallo-hydrolase [Solirubrobacterales bacterium]